ncbi:helix-turn-helix domain-containing protein [Dongshaea marina]|uniref:helix-turn-helix domain-containing protein n=1 Tax=Dongshaea marina TaxID=2047966 RepID=UPI000D3E7B24|nr:helix-turn-helix domain-containing protein [Dongshaea marina]
MKELSPSEREHLLKRVARSIFTGEITNGQALQKLRKEILQMSQEEYCKFAGVSRKTLSDIELDKGKPTVSILNRVFKPLGFECSLRPRSGSLAEDMFNTRYD